MERVNERKQVKCSNLPQDLSKYISVFSFAAFMQSYFFVLLKKRTNTKLCKTSDPLKNSILYKAVQ